MTVVITRRGRQEGDSCHHEDRKTGRGQLSLRGEEDRKGTVVIARIGRQKGNSCHHEDRKTGRGQLSSRG